MTDDPTARLREWAAAVDGGAEIERLTRFGVVVRRHLGDETTNALWEMTHDR